MDFPIKIMVIMLMALIAALMLIILMGGWNEQSSGIIKNLFNFFKLFGG